MDFINKQTSLNIFHNMSTGILIRDTSGNTLFCNQTMAKYFQSDVSTIMKYQGNELLEQGFFDKSHFDIAVRTKKEIYYEQKIVSGKKLLNHTIPISNNQRHVHYILEEFYDLDKLNFYTSPSTPSANENSAPLPATDTTEKPTCVQFKSAEMQKIYKMADQMAIQNINILILGESGTGKSQLAKRIHDKSERRNNPFITINCSTLPPNLIESELFGYKKGAFSGANTSGKQGLVELANHGTIFLDEIGELPLSVQAKLLQFVQEKSFLPVGDTEMKCVDTRIIAATNQDLSLLVSNGKFREDLYYRLAVVTLKIPPLGERKQDILTLIQHFSNHFNRKYNLRVTFSNTTIQLLSNYNWPGNIRELEHLIEFLILNCRDDHVTPDMLPEKIYSESTIKEILPDILPDNTFEDITSLQEYLDNQEKVLIQTLYKKYPNSYKLANRLKVSQSKASRLIRKYITTED